MSKIIEIFIEKGIIKHNTVITAMIKDYSLVFSNTSTINYFLKDLFVIRALKENNDIKIICKYMDNDTKIVYVNSNDIKKIDGMEIEKIAKVYGFNMDGSRILEKRKRGRKPKIKNIEKYI